MGRGVLRPLRRHGSVARPRPRRDRPGARCLVGDARLSAGHPGRQAGLGRSVCVGARFGLRTGSGHQQFHRGAAGGGRRRDDLARWSLRDQPGPVVRHPRAQRPFPGRRLRRCRTDVFTASHRLRHRGVRRRRRRLDRIAQPGVGLDAAGSARPRGVVHAAGVAHRPDRRRPERGPLGRQRGRQTRRGQRDGDGLRRVRRADQRPERQDHGRLRDPGCRVHLRPIVGALRRIRSVLRLESGRGDADDRGQRRHYRGVHRRRRPGARGLRPRQGSRDAVDVVGGPRHPGQPRAGLAHRIGPRPARRQLQRRLQRLRHRQRRR